MNWDEISLEEKGDFIKTCVRHNITNRDRIIELYNMSSLPSYEDEEESSNSPEETESEVGGGMPIENLGYNEWKKRIGEITGVNPDDDMDYNYKGYYDDDPGRAWQALRTANAPIEDGEEPQRPDFSDFFPEQYSFSASSRPANRTSNIGSLLSNSQGSDEINPLDDSSYTGMSGMRGMDRGEAMTNPAAGDYSTKDVSGNMYGPGGQLILKARALYDATHKANFMQRMKDPNRKTIKDWETSNVATHKLGWDTTDDGRAIVYPEVQEINGKLVDFTRPPYAPDAGYKSAVSRGDTIMTTPDVADWFTRNYKFMAPGFNQYSKGGHMYAYGTDDDDKNKDNIASVVGTKALVEPYLREGEHLVPAVYNYTTAEWMPYKQLPEVTITAKRNPDIPTDDYYLAHSPQRAAFQQLVAERPGYEGLRKFSTIAAMGPAAFMFAPYLGSLSGAAADVAWQGSKSALGAAGKLMMPSTWTTAIGLPTGVGAVADAGFLGSMAGHAFSDLTTKSNWQPGGKYNNDNWGGFQSGINLTLDASMLSPLAKAGTGAVKLANKGFGLVKEGFRDIANFTIKRNPVVKINNPISKDMTIDPEWTVANSKRIGYLPEGLISSLEGGSGIERGKLLTGNSVVSDNLFYNLFGQPRQWYMGNDPSLFLSDLEKVLAREKRYHIGRHAFIDDLPKQYETLFIEGTPFTTHVGEQPEFALRGLRNMFRFLDSPEYKLRYKGVSPKNLDSFITSIKDNLARSSKHFIDAPIVLPDKSLTSDMIDPLVKDLPYNNLVEQPYVAGYFTPGRKSLTVSSKRIPGIKPSNVYIHELAHTMYPSVKFHNVQPLSLSKEGHLLLQDKPDYMKYILDFDEQRSHAFEGLLDMFKQGYPLDINTIKNYLNLPDAAKPNGVVTLLKYFNKDDVANFMLGVRAYGGQLLSKKSKT